MQEQYPSLRQKRRRVPDEYRKRCSQSCDLCRKRRSKCVPSETPEGKTCVTCAASNLLCSFDLPRKTRFYGSWDGLSDRYRCLEALLKGAFPNEVTDTVDDLMELGSRMGYQMPNLFEEAEIDPSALVKGNPRPANKVSRSRRTEYPSSPNSSSTQSIRPIYTHSEENAKHSINPGMLSHHRRSDSLIRDTSGHAHFIGASGGLSFLSELRQLVQTRNMRSSQDNGAIRSYFINEDPATSLEMDEPNLIKESEALTLPGGEKSRIGYTKVRKDLLASARPDPTVYLQLLPPEQVMQDLLDNYFVKAHPDFPLFDRASFEDDYELYIAHPRSSVPASNLPIQPVRQVPGPDWGWLACFHMILTFGSFDYSNPSHTDYKLLRQDSLEMVRSCLPHLVTKSVITNVQALLLLALHLHNNNNRNGAWSLLGTAIRHSFSLGLHQNELGKSFRPLERELRKRVFCTLFGFEQFLSSSLGRPSGVVDTDIDIQVPRDGLLDDGTGLGSQLTCSALALQKILGQTRVAVVRLREKESDYPRCPIHLTPSVPDSPDKAILELLNDWWQFLPASLSIGSIETVDGVVLPKLPSRDIPAMSLDELETNLSRQTRAQLRALITLHIQYHYTALLVTRPTLLMGIASGSQATRNVTTGCSDPCCSSLMATACRYHACQLSALIVLLGKFKLINGVTSLDVFYAYSAGLILVLSLLGTAGPVDQHDDCVIDAAVDTPQLNQNGTQRCDKVLLGHLRSAIGGVEKSGTMKRTESVMNKFADFVLQGEIQGKNRWRFDIMNESATEGSFFTNQCRLQRTNNGDGTEKRQPMALHGSSKSANASNSCSSSTNQNVTSKVDLGNSRDRSLLPQYMMDLPLSQPAPTNPTVPGFLPPSATTINDLNPWLMSQENNNSNVLMDWNVRLHDLSSTFWYDSLEDLADGQFLDWADLENFLEN